MKGFFVGLFIIITVILCSAQYPSSVCGGGNGSDLLERKWLNDRDTEIMRVNYRKPDRFDEISGYETFKYSPDLQNIVGRSVGHQLNAQDGQCIIFICFFEPINDIQYVISHQHHSPDNPCKVLDMRHMWQIRASVIYALGYDYDYFLQKKNFVNWRRYLEYYPDKQTQKIFNADTAIRVSLNLLPDKVYNYKEKYKYLDMLVLQKMKRGFIQIFVFTTEEGRKNLPYYWEKIETIFRYQE